MENSTNNKKKKRGFTLVELVIVLAVMGIIALIAIPSLAGTKENFKIKSDKKSCETIKRAVEIIALDDEEALAEGEYLVGWGANNKVSTVTVKLATGKTATSNETETASTIEKSLKDTNAAQTDKADKYLVKVEDKGKVITVSVVNSTGAVINNITTAKKTTP